MRYSFESYKMKTASSCAFVILFQFVLLITISVSFRSKLLTTGI
jgi:hypothetical protein